MEYLDYFDAKHNLLGKEEKFTVHKQALWHHTFQCWIYTSNREVLFQLRAKRLISNPNLLDISSAGHIQAGETPLEGGLRELKEELGLSVNPADLLHLGVFQHAADYKYPDGTPNRNREFGYVYLLKSDKALDEYTLQRKELEGLYSADLDDLFKLFSREVEKIRIKGYSFNEHNNLIYDDREVEITAFNPGYKPEHYLKIFIMIERALEGKKYFGV